MRLPINTKKALGKKVFITELLLFFKEQADPNRVNIQRRKGCYAASMFER